METTARRMLSSERDNRQIVNLETVNKNVFVKNQSADFSNKVRVGYHKL